MGLQVALAAEEAAGIRVLRLLLERGDRPAVVFAGPDAGAAGASLSEVAGGEGLEVRAAADVRNPGSAELLRDAGVELLLNVHSLHIVDEALLEVPVHGAFNLHPGPLPERAGLNAPSWAVYEAAAAHGVTIHRMTKGVDEGPLAFAESFALGPEATGLSVSAECTRRGVALIGRLLEAVGRGEPVPAEQQDPSRRRWLPAGPPEGGVLDWGRPADQLDAFVRACDYGPLPSPWGHPRCGSRAGPIGVVRARPTRRPAEHQPGRVESGPDGTPLVAAGDRLVAVETVELAGSRRAAREVLEPGEILESAGLEPDPDG